MIYICTAHNRHYSISLIPSIGICAFRTIYIIYEGCTTNVLYIYTRVIRCRRHAQRETDTTLKDGGKRSNLFEKKGGLLSINLRESFFQFRTRSCGTYMCAIYYTLYIMCGRRLKKRRNETNEKTSLKQA